MAGRCLARASRASRVTASVQGSGATAAGRLAELTFSGREPSLVRCAASHASGVNRLKSLPGASSVNVTELGITLSGSISMSCSLLTSDFRLRLARRRRSNEKVPLTWKNRTCLGTYQPRVEGTFPVKNSARTARVMVSADGRGLVSQAGAVLLWETMRVTGLGRGLSTGLDRWRAPRATSPPREELSRNSVHLDEAGPRPRGTSSQGRLNELTECQP